MASNVAVAVTAAVGIAGIASTHLLARAQRKTDVERVRSERADRYRFAAHEAQSALYADYLAELRLLLLMTQLRVKFVASLRQVLAAAVEDERLDLDESARQGIVNAGDDLLSDENWARESDVPPRLDTVATIRRLTELEARIYV